MSKNQTVKHHLVVLFLISLGCFMNNMYLCIWRIGIAMVEFKFIDYGTDFGTTDMGQKLRQKLLPIINGNEKVVLDFTGVNVVSNSFADECIAKLLLEMPLSELKRRTTFRGLNPLAERSVLVALQRRYKVLSAQDE